MGVPSAFSPDHAAYYFTTDHKLVDADGAPNAYHPADVPNTCPETGRGIDCLAAAGYPDGSWWQTVLVADPADPTRPAIQQDGPYKGFFVSMTSLRNTEFAGPASTASYVDAAAIPYIVLPAPIYRTDGMGEMGDIGFATNLDTGQTTPFVIADEGPVERLGEASVAFWRALGVQAPNPRTGEGLPDGRIAYVVFPGSAKDASIGWPIDQAKLARAARAARCGRRNVRIAVVRATEDRHRVRIRSAAEQVIVALLLLASLPSAPAPTRPWTPHRAAALLDASFPSEQACQTALESARDHERVTPSKPVHDLSYARLFAQARCSSAAHKAGIVWRIRMHWPRRT